MIKITFTDGKYEEFPSTAKYSYPRPGHQFLVIMNEGVTYTYNINSIFSIVITEEE